MQKPLPPQRRRFEACLLPPPIMVPVVKGFFSPREQPAQAAVRPAMPALPAARPHPAFPAHNRWPSQASSLAAGAVSDAVGLASCPRPGPEPDVDATASQDRQKHPTWRKADAKQRRGTQKQRPGPPAATATKDFGHQPWVPETHKKNQQSWPGDPCKFCSCAKRAGETRALKKAQKNAAERVADFFRLFSRKLSGKQKFSRARARSYI